MRIAFAVTRASSLDVTWTTVHLAVSALARGWSVRIVEPWDFEVDRRHRLLARTWAFDGPLDAAELVAALRERSADRRYLEVARSDLLMLRAAPLDPTLLTFGAMARDRGVVVVNDPDGLLRVSHKAWLAALADVRTPTTLVTRSQASAVALYRTLPNGAVIKPARGSGGKSVRFVGPDDEDSLDDAIRAAKRAGDGFIVVQAYVPAAAEGEKRLVWLDGALIGGYLRRRAPGEFRHNLKQGGVAVPTVLSPSDHALCASVSPHLQRAGIRLAGLDVIGSWLIEVNALNPGGAYHVDRLNGTRLADQILTQLTQPEAQGTRWALHVP